MAKRQHNGQKTTQWPKEKGQKDKQRSTKHTNKTKDQVTRTPLKTGVNSWAPEGYKAVPAQQWLKLQERFQETKRVISRCKSKDDKRYRKGT